MPPRILLDLTDLLEFLESFRSPMGVARVQMALLEAGLAEGAPPLFDLTTYDPLAGRFVEFPSALMQEMIRASRRGGHYDQPDWIALRDEKRRVRAAAPAFAFQPEDRVVALGLTGANPHQLRRLRELRQAHGVQVCALFYDAIPLAVPEHCELKLTRSFAEHFLGMCLQIDRAVAISACSAQDFRTWQRRMLPHLDVPVGVMPLNAQFAPLLEDAPPEQLPEVLREGRPFVLCVATIEARKNHLLLLHAWLTLLRRHGHAVIPDLVLLGRPGFHAGPALQLIEAAPELRARVTRLENAGDAVLKLLYERCLFTVFNSFYEGWGLPVTEALAHGKLALTPDHTSLREAGGSAALYFTPQSEPELVELIWSLLRDPERRRQLEAAIPERVTLRGWRDVAQGLVDSLLAPAAALPEPVARLHFPMGSRIGFEAPAIPDLPALPAPGALLHQLLCEGEGWGLQERWGIWAMRGPARLRLPLHAPSGGPLALTLEVTAPPTTGTELRLRAICPGAAPEPWLSLALGAGEARHVRVTVPPCEAGDLVIAFDTSAARQVPGDDRALSVLVTGLMLCLEADEQVQLRYLADRVGLTRLTSAPADPG